MKIHGSNSRQPYCIIGCYLREMVADLPRFLGNDTDSGKFSRSGNLSINKDINNE